MPTHWVILREEDVGASRVVATSLVEVSGIGVACKDHIACTVGDEVFWVCGNIVKELVDSVISGLGGRRLLGDNGSESDKNFIFNCTYVPQEGADDTLDAFYAGRVKRRA